MLDEREQSRYKQVYTTPPPFTSKLLPPFPLPTHL